MRFRRGFTLIELMIVIVILGILIGVGVPAFNRFMREHRLTGTTNKFVTALNRSRNEAITTGAPTILCPNSAATIACNGSDYSNGWVVISDVNANGNADGADRLVHHWDGVNFAIAAFTGTNRITYNNQGLRSNSAATATFNIQANGCSGQQRTIQVNTVGNISTAHNSC